MKFKGGLFLLVGLLLIVIVIAAPVIDFTSPSASSSNLPGPNVAVNVSIVEDDLDSLIYNWNGTNFSMYDDNLVLMYNFDNKSSLGENNAYVVDLSGKGHNGTIVGDGDELSSSSKYGSFALDMDGNSDRVTIPTSSDWDFGSNNFTIESWIYYKGVGTGTDPYIFEHFSAPGGWALRYISSNSLYFYSSWSSFTGVSYVFSTNAWTHISIVKSGSDLNYYANGVLLETDTAAATYGTDGGPLEIGYSTSNPTRYFNAKMDDIKIWNGYGMGSEQVYQSYISNLAKLNSSDWILSVNQSQNLTDGLSDGDYTYQVIAEDSVGGITVSEERDVSIDPVSFISTWNTSKSGISNATQIVLPLEDSGTYDFTINWGDGTTNQSSDYTLPSVNHSYSDEGTYTVKINGTIIGWAFNNGGDKDKITDISQWGDLNVGNSTGYFYGCSNLNSSATDALNLSGTTTLTSMFYGATLFNGNISNWDTSKVTIMTETFRSATNFNQNISSWDTSNVTTMSGLFRSATNFNQDIGGWDVSNVINMAAMFDSARNFNQDIDNWNVSGVTNMNSMFSVARAFNQNLTSWDTSSVTVMTQMFNGARAFNGNISNWDVSGISSFDYMFYQSSFNQDISNWNVSGATSMYATFGSNSKFNQNLSAWDVSSVTNMIKMFTTATNFSQNISAWDVSSVIDMDYMFHGASNFNQDISNWDVSSVTDMNRMFNGATSFDQDIGDWNVSKVEDMSDMFDGATLSRTNYDSLLNGWSARTLINNTLFDGGNSVYCYGGSARDNTLVAIYNWSITDGGEDPVCDLVSPDIELVGPTITSSAYTGADSVYVNVSASDNKYNISTFIDFGDLVSWWRFDNVNGSGDLTDYTGRNNGSLEGGALINSSGYFGDGLQLDGDGDYIEIKESLAYPNFTISAWIYVNGFDTSGFSIFSASNLNNKGYYFWVDADNDLSLSTYSSEGQNLNVKNNVIIPNQWYHVSAVRNGTNVSLYVNGAEQNLDEITPSLMDANTDVVRIGRAYTYTNFDSNGSIDDIMIFNRSLTAAEVAGLYANTTSKYVEHNYTGLASGNYSYTAYAQDEWANINSTSYSIVVDQDAPSVVLNAPANNSVQNASVNMTVNLSDSLSGIDNATLNVYHTGSTWLDFDGDDDYVQMDNQFSFPIGTSFAWGTWFKPNLGGNELNYLMRQDKTGGERSIFSIIIDTSDDISCMLYNGSIVESVKASVNLVAGNWYHIMCVRDKVSNQIIVYINGAKDNNDTDLTSGGYDSPDNIFIVGMDPRASSNNFNGSIDEVRIYNTSLTESQISDIYNAGLVRDSTLPSEGLVSWYDFETGSGTNLVDRVAGVNNGTISGATWTNKYHSSVIDIVADTWDATVGVVVDFVDGIYTWFYELFDNVGNSATSENFTLIVDAVVPELEFISPTPSDDGSASGSFTLNVSLNESRLSNVTYNWNSTEYKMLEDYSSDYFLKNVSDLFDGLVLMMNFENLSEYSENDSYVVDYSGYGNNGTVVNAVYNSSGKYGQAMSFDGEGDYIEVADDDILEGMSSLTVAFWINPRVLTYYGHILVKGDANAYSEQAYGFHYEGGLHFRTNTGDGERDTVTSINTNEWTFITGTYNGSNVKLYNNGNLISSNTDSGSIKTNSNPLYIGWAPSRGANYFNGSIDEVMIFNRSLSADEIKQLYSSNINKYPNQENNFSVAYSENKTEGNANMTLTSTDPDMNEFYFSAVQGNLVVGNDYTYNVSAYDVVNNFATTATRTISGNTLPTVHTLVQSITSNGSLDPNTNLTFLVNVSDVDLNFDSAIFQWRNATATDWTNITMTNLSVISAYTYLSSNLTLPSYEANITYRIFMSDTTGSTNTSSNYTIVSYWDCTWAATSALGAVAGWNENEFVGNISVNNTGDTQHSTGCTTDFRLNYDLSEGRIYLDNKYYKPSSTYSIGPNQSQIIAVNATFGTEAKQEDVVISVEEITSYSDTEENNVSLTLVTNQEGPYLFQEITTNPSEVLLSSGNTFSLEGYVRNLMGSSVVNENNTAYNVSFYWSLPSGLENDSGALTLSFTNITNNSLIENDLNVSFSDLASMANGVKTIYLYAQGYNLSGDLIQHSSNQTLLTEEVNITFSCSNVSDGIVVASCGSLDADYVSSSTVAATTGSGSGGGSARGVVTQRVETSADFQLVRGKENEVKISVKNSDLNSSITDVVFSVRGDIAKYIDIFPKSISVIAPGEEIFVTLKIISPTYIELGRQEISLSIEGKKDAGDYSEIKKVTLEIHDLSREEVFEYLNKSREFLADLEEANLSYDYLDSLFEDSLAQLEVFGYEKIEANYLIIEAQVESALKTKDIIDDLHRLIELAESKEIEVGNSLRLVKLAELSLQRKEFEQALDRAKDARITYALEVKGEIGSIRYYAMVYPKEISLSALFLLIFSFGSFRVGKLQILKKRIKALREEEAILQQLVSVVQVECFEKKKMSMEEYETAISQYQEKMHKVIEKIIKLENKRVYALRFTSKNVRIKLERSKLVEMMKDLQRDYIQKGNVETGAYQMKLESYNKRLTEIDEHIAVLEAEKAVKKQRRFFGFFGGPKLGVDDE